MNARLLVSAALLVVPSALFAGPGIGTSTNFNPEGPGIYGPAGTNPGTDGLTDRNLAVDGAQTGLPTTVIDAGAGTPGLNLGYQTDAAPGVRQQQTLSPAGNPLVQPAVIPAQQTVTRDPAGRNGNVTGAQVPGARMEAVGENPGMVPGAGPAFARGGQVPAVLGNVVKPVPGADVAGTPPAKRSEADKSKLAEDVGSQMDGSDLRRKNAAEPTTVQDEAGGVQGRGQTQEQAVVTAEQSVLIQQLRESPAGTYRRVAGDAIGQLLANIADHRPADHTEATIPRNLLSALKEDGSPQFIAGVRTLIQIAVDQNEAPQRLFAALQQVVRTGEQSSKPFVEGLGEWNQLFGVLAGRKTDNGFKGKLNSIVGDRVDAATGKDLPNKALKVTALGLDIVDKSPVAEAAKGVGIVPIIVRALNNDPDFLAALQALQATINLWKGADAPGPIAKIVRSAGTRSLVGKTARFIRGKPPRDYDSFRREVLLHLRQYYVEAPESWLLALWHQLTGDGQSPLIVVAPASGVLTASRQVLPAGGENGMTLVSGMRMYRP